MAYAGVSHGYHNAMGRGLTTDGEVVVEYEEYGPLRVGVVS